MPDNPYERYHLFWDDTVSGFRSSHWGLDIPEERFIDRTNPIETVEWLLPGWRVLTRLRTEQTLDWTDTGDTYWRLAGRKEPRREKGVREHLLLALDPDTLPDEGRPDGCQIGRLAGQWPVAEHATTNQIAHWMLFSLATTNTRPFFRSYGRAPISSHHWRNWTASERVWATSFALRTAVVAPTPYALVTSLCGLHEDPPPDRKWWPIPDLAHTLAAGLAGQTGSGTHHSGASRKVALARHADTLQQTRTTLATMQALGALREWDDITAPDR